jgi:hypothetical protein
MADPADGSDPAVDVSPAADLLTDPAVDLPSAHAPSALAYIYALGELTPALPAQGSKSSRL